MVSKRLYIWRPFSVTAIFFLSASFTAIMAQDGERPLKLSDIMPTDKKLYDKMRPPKFQGQKLALYDFFAVPSILNLSSCSPSDHSCSYFKYVYHQGEIGPASPNNLLFSGNATEVLFHVTVMSLDTIDESSMVSKIFSISSESQ